jgi:hypothetical protein
MVLVFFFFLFGGPSLLHTNMLVFHPEPRAPPWIAELNATKDKAQHQAAMWWSIRKARGQLNVLNAQGAAEKIKRENDVHLRQLAKQSTYLFLFFKYIF